MFRFACAFALILSSRSAGADFQISSLSPNYGWYNSDGERSLGNTFTGKQFLPSSPTGEYRSFFAFDLGTVSGFIGGATQAVLSITLEEYFGPDDSNTFVIHQYSEQHATVAEMISGGSPPPQATRLMIFGDLGSGPIYGQQVVTANDVGTQFDITLSSQSLTDLNSHADQLFAFGISLASPFNQDQINDAVRFGVDATVIATLSVAAPGTQDVPPNPDEIDNNPVVPEPSTWASFLCGLCCIGLFFKSPTWSPRLRCGRIQ